MSNNNPNNSNFNSRYFANKKPDESISNFIDRKWRENKEKDEKKLKEDPEYRQKHYDYLIEKCEDDFKRYEETLDIFIHPEKYKGGYFKI